MKIAKNYKNKKALVIGAGSIGEKHIRNLNLLGFETSILEIDFGFLLKLEKLIQFLF